MAQAATEPLPVSAVMRVAGAPTGRGTWRIDPATLRRLLDETGFSQRGLARRAHVSQMAVSTYLRDNPDGGGNSAQPAVVICLAAALEAALGRPVTPASLCIGTEAEEGTR